MRLWSVHPKYLDTKGLTACWREGLLARKVLSGKTAGYRNHPQLLRFKSCDSPIAMLDNYLYFIAQEATARGYGFDLSKISAPTHTVRIKVTDGQLRYEFEHLCRKLQLRDNARYCQLATIERIEPNPIFEIIEGDIAPWEKTPAAHK